MEGRGNPSCLDRHVRGCLLRGGQNGRRGNPSCLDRLDGNRQGMSDQWIAAGLRKSVAFPSSSLFTLPLLAFLETDTEAKVTVAVVWSPPVSRQNASTLRRRARNLLE